MIRGRLGQGGKVVIYDASGQLHYGYDEWESLCVEDKPRFDFLCANHARNLLMDELSRLFED